MDNEKMKNQTTEMNAQDLEQVSGGSIPDDFYDTRTVKVVRRDSRGNPTHWQVEDCGVNLGEPYHFICPNCGRLLHEGTLSRLYCDPCDESWFQMTIGGSYKRKGIYSGR